MEDKQYAILRKKDFNSFIIALSKLYKLAAPGHKPRILTTILSNLRLLILYKSVYR